jgi:hypothetical protein
MQIMHNYRMQIIQFMQSYANQNESSNHPKQAMTVHQLPQTNRDQARLIPTYVHISSQQEMGSRKLNSMLFIASCSVQTSCFQSPLRNRAGSAAPYQPTLECYRRPTSDHHRSGLRSSEISCSLGCWWLGVSYRRRHRSSSAPLLRPARLSMPNKRIVDCWQTAATES